VRSNRGGKGGRVATLLERATHCSVFGKYCRAETLLLRALRLAGPIGPLSNCDQLCLWIELGMVYKYLGEFSKAAEFYRLASQHASSYLEGRQLDFFLANLYHNLGGLEHSRRRYRRGERYARKSLKLRRKVSGENSLGAASDMAGLAALLDGLGKFQESERLYRKALKIYRRNYGPSHRENAVILNNLAALYHATGRTMKAKAQYRVALEMKRRELGASHPDVGVTLNNLGILYTTQGKTRAALTCFQKALRILDQALGKAHPNTRAVRGNVNRLGRNVRMHDPRAISS
jgi:tetratricopeptide (TPR) repeat protein